MRLFRAFPSITARLILGLTLGTSLVWCGAASYSIYISYKELNEAFDRALVEAANRLLPLAADDVLGHDQSDDGLGHEQAEGRAIRHYIEGRKEYLSYQLRDSTGKIILRARDAPVAPYDRLARAGLSTAGNYRIYTDTDVPSGLTITVAETMDGRREALTVGMRAMLWPLIGLIPLNILAIWLAVRSAMRPVLRLSRDISTRSGRNLAPLDISDQPAELRPIADSVALLVERLRAALDAERAFAANSAHELRTPIAGALAQTQRMIAELGDPKDRRRARDVEITLKRLSTLAEKLMQISRVDAGVGVSDTNTDLLPVLDLVVGDCAKRLDDAERISYIKPAGTALIAGMDIDAFAIAVRNLIDNALNHGVEGGVVEVRAGAGGTVSVINGCAVVAPDVLAGLKRRFIRGQTRSAGSGLGLAIVEAIMEQTGGRLELLSPASGRQDGFEARLVIR